MDRLHIRTATLEDLEQIAAIEAACFPPEQAGSREDIRQRKAGATARLNTD